MLTPDDPLVSSHHLAPSRRSSSFLVNTMSFVRVHQRQIGEQTVVRLINIDILQLQVIDDIVEPIFSERLPAKYIDVARAEH